MANKLQKIVNKPKPAKKQKPVPVKIVSEPSTASPAEDMGWKTRSALETLSRADEIRRDKPLMKAVKAEARKQIKSLSNVK